MTNTVDRKIVVFGPRSGFSPKQQARLAHLGHATYLNGTSEIPIHQLISTCSEADTLAFEPLYVGGIENARPKLLRILTSVPTIKNLALSTTNTSYIDPEFCHQNGLHVTNSPHCFDESLAEHTIALILGAAKAIFASDRSSQKNQFQLQMGTEIKGKTLGIIGLGHIGSQTARLALGLGMQVIAYNRTPKSLAGVKSVSLSYLLAHSDIISLHLAINPQTLGFLSANKIAKLKPGVIIVNTADSRLIDTTSLASALTSGQIGSYLGEADDVHQPPLASLPNAFLFPSFGWYTKEALALNREIWLRNIEGLVRHHPPNPVFNSEK